MKTPGLRHAEWAVVICLVGGGQAINTGEAGISTWLEKPHAVDVRVDVDPAHWFLDERDDTRSSYYLEDAATEFQIQGLELDWTCVTWDADLRRAAGAWSHHASRGRAWTRMLSHDRRRYLCNAYRVLLARARQGMAIFIPAGDCSDPTRHPDFYDGTFQYLADFGIPVIE